MSNSLSTCSNRGINLNSSITAQVMLLDMVTVMDMDMDMDTNRTRRNHSWKNFLTSRIGQDYIRIEVIR